MEVETPPGLEGAKRKSEKIDPNEKFREDNQEKGGGNNETPCQANPHQRPPNTNTATLDSLQTLILQNLSAQRFNHKQIGEK